MEFKILAPGADDLRINQALPLNYRGAVLPLATPVQVWSDFGTMLFQQFKGVGFDIWFSNYEFLQKTVLVGRADVPILELHIHLLDPAHTIWNGGKETALSPFQYNITYVPFMDSSSRFMAGKHCQSFDIHFQLPYLQRLSPLFPVLESFLNKVEKQIPSGITGIDRFLSPQMLAIVKEILACPFQNGAAVIYIEAKVVELLLLILQECSNENPLAPIKLLPYDVEQLHEVRRLVTTDFEQQLSIVQLARKVGINEFKLKKGFKYLFGTTIFGYMNTIRMDKARQLLLETDTPIEDIAFMSGFEFGSNFNKAFKKHFGYTPAYLRKNR